MFDEAGYLYVSDSLQATIFRYPPGGGTPEELGSFLRAEIAKWTRLVREAGIRAE